MRSFLATLAFLASPGLAQEAANLGMAPGVMVNTTISINAPMSAADPAGRQAEEDAHRKVLYTRSAGECAMLIDTVARSCTVVAVNVSTQVNTAPGQPDYLYATVSISMQVELK